MAKAVDGHFHLLQSVLCTASASALAVLLLLLQWMVVLMHCAPKVSKTCEKFIGSWERVKYVINRNYVITRSGTGWFF